jgi:hypothetical protein
MCCPFDISPSTPIGMMTHTQMVLLSKRTTSASNTTAKHVHFDEYDAIISAPSPLDDHFDSIDEYCSATWYRMEELEKFRNDAREICREMKYNDALLCFTADTTNSGHQSDSDSSTTSNPSQRIPSLARNSSTRGLEQRTCTERQRRKYLSTRFILKVAPQLYQHNPNKLAELSLKCNAWATDLAIEEGIRDFRRVSDDCMTDSVTVNNDSPNKKRSMTDSNEHTPKRNRTTPHSTVV